MTNENKFSEKKPDCAANGNCESQAGSTVRVGGLGLPNAPYQPCGQNPPINQPSLAMNCNRQSHWLHRFVRLIFFSGGLYFVWSISFGARYINDGFTAFLLVASLALGILALYAPPIFGVGALTQREREIFDSE